MKKSNRLINEKSPYLLQHAYNPVNWYAWGQEAFDKSLREGKPIFLSIGYSTCHWCHVMEKESFEDEQIAETLNKYFVAIKVDREERPDLDHVYMTSVSAMTGQGGWPLSVFLTPERKPFFGGTYFPPYPKWGSPGFIDVLQSVHHAWQTNKDEVLKSSSSFVEALINRTQSRFGPPMESGILDKAFEEFRQSFDPEYGGFGHQPKFPSSHNLSFLLRYAVVHPASSAISMAEKTLKAMAQSGMYDHLRGGFHRYSTDREWQVPHFEKMLYDQAMLLRTYLEMYQITKDLFYAQVAKEIADYVLRDMQSPEGGFYSAEDADSFEYEGAEEKKEGAFYVWSYGEIKALLSEDEFRVVADVFGLEQQGNARFDPHGEFAGKNILHMDRNISEDDRKFLNSAKHKLFEEQKKRPRPYLDDKVLTDWNGLMTASLAFAYRVLGNKEYLTAAQKSADFILNKMLRDKKLLHRYRDGDAGINGTLDDYAYFVHGLLEVYEASLDVKYIEKAVMLNEQMIILFEDLKSGGFYQTTADAEDVLYRAKEIYDGAYPSGNSIALYNLARFYYLTLESRFEEKVQKALACFGADIAHRPSAYAQMLMAYQFLKGPVKELVLAGGDKDKDILDVLKVLNAKFLPHKVILFKDVSLDQKFPFLKTLPAASVPRLFICENHACQAPVEGIEGIIKVIEQF